MYHNLWCIIQSKLYILLFPSLFRAPDPLFCTTLVPQNVVHVVHSSYVPQFQAHNLPVPCSSNPLLPITSNLPYYSLLLHPTIVFLPIPHSFSTSTYLFMLYSIENMVRFPKDHTPQVRPDLVPAVHFGFFIYFKIYNVTILYKLCRKMPHTKYMTIHQSSH